MVQYVVYPLIHLSHAASLTQPALLMVPVYVYILECIMCWRRPDLPPASLQLWETSLFNGV